MTLHLFPHGDAGADNFLVEVSELMEPEFTVEGSGGM